MTSGFLGAIPVELSDALSQYADQVTHPIGFAIHHRGAPARPGVVVAGLVRAYVTSSDGREATVFYVRPGEAIGLLGAFDPVPAVSLQAVAETTILYFDEARFDEMLSTEVDLAFAVVACLAERSAAWCRTFHGFVFGRVRGRVAAHLLTLAVRDEHGRLVAHVTQQELANAVGSVRDVVARVLRELRRDGLVITSHGRVVLTDEDGLRSEASKL
jgi:CRP/FNR family cyclic AMP-dependent transcriptional regulator